MSFPSKHSLTSPCLCYMEQNFGKVIPPQCHLERKKCELDSYRPERVYCRNIHDCEIKGNDASAKLKDVGTNGADEVADVQERIIDR